jgi:hypothetical protein
MARLAVDGGGLGHDVIDPMGQQLAVARGAAVVLERCDGLGGEGRANTVHIPEPCLLLRGDGQHGIASHRVLAPSACHVVKLGVALRMMAHRLFLPRWTAASVALPQQPSDGAATRGRPQGPQAT